MSNSGKLKNHEQIALTKYDLYYESRLTKLETINEQIVVELRDIKNKMDNDTREIRSDIKWLLGLMIGFAGILSGLMTKGFHWL